MKKILFILLILCMAFTNAYATDNVEFKASAPAQVIQGRPFQLTYTINQSASDLRVPEFTDFERIAGPYTSQSSSTSFVNGKRTSSYTLTYTYTLIANNEGTFSLAPATIKVNGTQYTSNGVRITVLPPDQITNNTASSTQQNSGEVFIRTLVSKTNVHEQEAILLTYKLYFAGVDIAQLTNNIQLPEFKNKNWS